MSDETEKMRLRLQAKSEQTLEQFADIVESAGEQIAQELDVFTSRSAEEIFPSLSPSARHIARAAMCFGLAMVNQRIMGKKMGK